MKLHSIQPKPNERAIFIGQTGSGKSTLARYMLRTRRKPVWVLDVNQALDWHLPSNDYPDGEYHKVTRIEDMIEYQDYPRLLLQPPVEHMDDFEYFDLFFKTAFLKERLTLYVDEAYAVTNRQVIPTYYKACLTRGRGKGIETWTATQRPSGIPSFLLSECENFYVFTLRFPADVKRVKEMLPFGEEVIRSQPKRIFCYSDGKSAINNLTLNIKG